MKAILAASLLVVWSVSAHAHHGNSEYDLTQELKYEGTIVENLWKNPHTITKVATKTTAGEDIVLEVEGASPSVLRVGGFTADSLKAGDKVTAVVSPSRRFPKESAYGYEIIKADGTVVPLVSARLRKQQVSQTADDIFGTWVPTAESFAKLTRSLGTWPLTEKAAAMRSKFTPVASGQAQCQPVSAPMLMVYPVAMVLEKAADQIAIKTDWLGAERTVYTDGRMHPAATERFPQGHSIGHFEGKVLVVDTTNFSDQETGGIPAGSSKHIVERFALSDDSKGLHYEYVLEDAEYLAGQVTGSAEMVFRPDLTRSGIACDKEIAQRFFRLFE